MRWLRDGLLSIACFAAVVGALAAVDERVLERLSLMVSDGSSRRWTAELKGLAEVVLQAARDQSIDNGPMMIFGVVAVILTLFMVRT